MWGLVFIPIVPTRPGEAAGALNHTGATLGKEQNGNTLAAGWRSYVPVSMVAPAACSAGMMVNPCFAPRRNRARLKTIRSCWPRHAVSRARCLPGALAAFPGRSKMSDHEALATSSARSQRTTILRSPRLLPREQAERSFRASDKEGSMASDRGGMDEAGPNA
jgi:hypothetical protein